MAARHSEVSDIELDDDDDEFYADDDYIYNQQYDIWEPRPEWMHPDCADTLLALEHGTCCMYPADALVRRALVVAEKVDRTLTEFDVAIEETKNCARTARELVLWIEFAPPLIAEIRAALRTADQATAAQLLCPVNRLSLLVLELSLRSGCPIACTVHGSPDRRPRLAPFVPVLEECQEALQAAVFPRPPRRRGSC